MWLLTTQEEGMVINNTERGFVVIKNTGGCMVINCTDNVSYLM